MRSRPERAAADLREGLMQGKNMAERVGFELKEPTLFQ
jgi:hypothetical protein